MSLRSGVSAHRTLAGLLGASVLATIGAAAAGPVPVEPAEPAGPASFGPGTAGAATTVTLITGDRVHLLDLPGDRQAVTVDPAPRADGGAPQFRVTQRGEATYVVPADIAALIPARLDAALFDVTSLAEQGLDDASSPTLPLILDYPDGQLRTLRDEPVPGMAVRWELASLGALAVNADRSPDTELGQAIQQLAGPDGGNQPGSAGRLAGVDKIWLDARVEAQLDRSTGQISAPAAWQAGFDGSGVMAAVLDTGIDETHPDLAGKVDAAVNFTEDGDTVDRNGHGTHVASTIAGTGAASGGARRGVAPGARLLSGKVLDAGGFGFTSWVIAGMEWAAGQGADIVNMSLGLGPGHGEGPLVTGAIERLSADHGTLFVVAAGNDGCPACIGSPGDAPAALTVGAVDRDDQLADFSSRGPVHDGHDLKPDLTAPGVEIAAARADGTGEGDDPADPYIAYSGTSMATPHVAGAVALLAQAHPELTGPELKAALMSTAVATDGLTVYDQGAGRVDVGRLLASPVLASVGSVSFGLVPFPADGPAGPLRRTVGYRNLTTEPVTVQLATDLAGVAGDDLAVSPSRLTIPPGGTASAEVVLDVAGGPPGRYGGQLLASTGDGAAPLRTPIGFFVAEQQFDLTLTAIARDGRPALASSIFPFTPVVDVETGEVQFEPCEVDPPGLDYCIRVPAGTYSVMAFVYTKPAWADSDGQNFPVRPLHSALVGDPELAVTADATVRLDARKAVEVQVRTPDHDSHANPGAAADLGWFRTSADGVTTADILLNGPGDQLEERLFLQPTDQVSAGSFLATSRFRRSAPEIVFDAAGLALDPVYYRADQFSDHSWQFPMLDGEATMPVVDAGQARPEDLAGVDLDGALALVRRADDIPVHQQSNRAAGAGARMVAIYNDQPGSSGETGERGSMLEVPTVRLSHEEGMALRERLGTGGMSLTATGTPSSPYRYDLVHAYRGRI
ncbi:MAG: S8 family peptidase, partial [Natronosporangium sp.]